MQSKTLRLLLAMAVAPGFAVAATPDLTAGTPPSDAEASAAYVAAQKAFQSTQANKVSGDKSGLGLLKPVSATDVLGPEVMVYSDPTREMVPGTNDPKNVPLEKIRVVVDVENTSLRDVMHKVVTQAARYTGPWQVKWRLKPENEALLDERVNLTAEAKFGDFVDLLTERVKNMSGVQLFVTTFNESRIIMVADTYY